MTINSKMARRSISTKYSTNMTICFTEIRTLVHAKPDLKAKGSYIRSCVPFEKRTISKLSVVWHHHEISNLPWSKNLRIWLEQTLSNHPRPSMCVIWSVWLKSADKVCRKKKLVVVERCVENVCSENNHNRVRVRVVSILINITKQLKKIQN